MSQLLFILSIYVTLGDYDSATQKKRELGKQNIIRHLNWCRPPSFSHAFQSKKISNKHGRNFLRTFPLFSRVRRQRSGAGIYFALVFWWQAFYLFVFCNQRFFTSVFGPCARLQSIWQVFLRYIFYFTNARERRIVRASHCLFLTAASLNFTFVGGTIIAVYWAMHTSEFVELKIWRNGIKPSRIKQWVKEMQSLRFFVILTDLSLFSHCEEYFWE